MLARLATRITDRPRRALLVLGLAVLAAGLLGGPVAGLLASGDGPVVAGSSSQRADALVEQATGAGAGPGVVALVAPPGGVASPQGRAAVAGVQRTLAADPDLRDVQAPRRAAGDPRVSRDGAAAIVTARVRAGAPEDELAARLTTAFADRDDVTLGGGAIAGEQIGEQAGSDLATAETLAFPVLALLAFLLFGSVRSALVPLATALAAILFGFLALRAATAVYDVQVYALNLMFALGLGLAVDYALFLVARYREEAGRGAADAAALRRTLTGAGPTVLFSAATVAVSLSALLVFEVPFIVSMGIGGVLIALAAALAALTVVPVLLAFWGPRIVAGRAGATGTAPATGAWSRVASAVMRRPGAVAVLTAAALLLVALPALRTQWTGVDASVLPASQSARVVHDALERDFAAADGSGAFVAVRAGRGAGPALERYAERLERLDGVTVTGAPRPIADGAWQVDLALAGEAVRPPAQRILAEVRAVPAPGTAYLGGEAAAFADQQSSIAGSLPLALAILVGGTLLVLWLMTGSVVLPVKTLLMNVLTAAATTGVLVLVFQDGGLGFASQGGI
ncbi:MAG: MMPL family transporter, partial [Solirubrobacteraceae bacterium]|nr:MMPL family transporter [Solirubrobacteraceae bacterium]